MSAFNEDHAALEPVQFLTLRDRPPLPLIPCVQLPYGLFGHCVGQLLRAMVSANRNVPDVSFLDSLGHQGFHMDLFNPIVAQEKFHPNFANCMAQRNPHDEAVLAQWGDGFIDRDGKFVEEFQTTFNSPFWELYLHAVLREVGCSIDFSHHAPDFVVTEPIPFVMEANVALNAKDARPESTPFDIELRPRNLNEFNRVAMVRLLNSISEKTRKYFKSYQHLPHVKDKPFVLALTPFDQPFFYLQVQRAIEAVLYGYYVDEQAHYDDPSRTTSIHATNMKTVKKNESVELPLGIFNDKSHEHISAVVFNSSATWGKVKALSNDDNPFVFFSAARHDPQTGDFYVFRGTKAAYSETLFDGLRVYHNPHAAHPLDWRVFQEPGALQAFYTDSETHAWQYWMDRPPLAARNLITFRIPREGLDEKELQKIADETPQGGWYRMPFTPELLDEIIGMQQGKGMDDGNVV